MIETSLPLSSTNNSSSGSGTIINIGGTDSDLVSDGHTYYSKILGLNRLRELVLACINGIADKIWSKCDKVANDDLTWFSTNRIITDVMTYKNSATFYYNSDNYTYCMLAIKDISATSITAYGANAVTSVTVSGNIGRDYVASWYMKTMCNFTIRNSNDSETPTFNLSDDYYDITNGVPFLMAHIKDVKTLNASVHGGISRKLFSFTITKEGYLW